MNGLEEQYGTEVNFYRLDAAVSENEATQTELGLRGHPSVALLNANGDVVQRYFGAQPADQLANDLAALIVE